MPEKTSGDGILWPVFDPLQKYQGAERAFVKKHQERCLNAVSLEAQFFVPIVARIYCKVQVLPPGERGPTELNPEGDWGYMWWRYERGVIH
jgi:hypothetical protein|tara:strand:- start:18505 stop:18777 length:273 start_codon:yes stop_codon:yes gene_type:complete